MHAKASYSPCRTLGVAPLAPARSAQQLHRRRCQPGTTTAVAAAPHQSPPDSNAADSGSQHAAILQRRQLLTASAAAAAAATLWLPGAAPPASAAALAEAAAAPSAAAAGAAAAATLPLVPKAALTPNLSISKVIKGCWQLSGGHRGDRASDRTGGEAAVADFRAFYEAGVTSFDAADHYGPAEVLMGRFLASEPGLRTRCQALTKYCVFSPLEMASVSKEGVRRAVDLSRKRLGVEIVDLMQVSAVGGLVGGGLRCAVCGAPLCLRLWPGPRGRAAGVYLACCCCCWVGEASWSRNQHARSNCIATIGADTSPAPPSRSYLNPPGQVLLGQLRRRPLRGRCALPDGPEG